jgi:hypothetical protein
VFSVHSEDLCKFNETAHGVERPNVAELKRPVPVIRKTLKPLLLLLPG